MSPADGEQHFVQIVDEFDGQSGDCCTDDPPPTPPDDTPLTLSPGRYRVTYSWLVSVTGLEGAGRIEGEPVELTVPFEQVPAGGAGATSRGNVQRRVQPTRRR